MKSHCRLYLLLILLANIALADFDVRRISDIHQRLQPVESRSISDGVVAGEKLFFVHDDAVHGFELWAHDFTNGIAALVKDIKPGVENGLGAAPILFALDGYLLFYADDGIHGDELWLSDGENDGTHLLFDRIPGAGSGGFQFIHAVKHPDGRLLIRIAGDITDQYFLLVSDSTAAGTTLSTDAADWRDYRALAGAEVAGNHYFFDAEVDSYHLWQRDAAGVDTKSTAFAIDYWSVSKIAKPTIYDVKNNLLLVKDGD